MVRVSEAARVGPPAYRVPSMRDVERVPLAGYRLVSTFSGCGGSCLGFRMAGFRTVWASEFVPAASDCYALNYPDVPLDTRDIRDVTPAEIMSAAHLEVGETDVLEGSPPCASFSSSGSLARGWGEPRRYSDTTQRVDDLFDEFARIRDGLMPRVFVAENVSGLVRGVSRGMFKTILRRLKVGYRVEARVLDAQWLGIPQMRQRVIFVGVRDDLPAAPAFPTPLPYRYTLRDVLPSCRSSRPPSEWQTVDEETGDDLRIEGFAVAKRYDRLRPGEKSVERHNLWRCALDRPVPTLTTVLFIGASAPTHPIERRAFSMRELRLLASFPVDFKLAGTYTKRAERIARAVPPLMMRRIASVIRDEILDPLAA